jgi:hypothetical protein
MEVNGIVDYRRWSIYAADFEGDTPGCRDVLSAVNAGGFGSSG